MALIMGMYQNIYDGGGHTEKSAANTHGVKLSGRRARKASTSSRKPRKPSRKPSKAMQAQQEVLQRLIDRGEFIV